MILQQKLEIFVKKLQFCGIHNFDYETWDFKAKYEFYVKSSDTRDFSQKEKKRENLVIVYFYVKLCHNFTKLEILPKKCCFFKNNKSFCFKIPDCRFV